MNNFCSIIADIEQIVKETDFKKDHYNISEKFEKQLE